MMKYLQLAAILAFVSMSFAVKILSDQKRELRLEVEALELQAEKTAENMKTLVQQLDREIEIRQLTESTLTELMNEVPDVVYIQQLPPEIQGVLDRFHDRIRP